MKMVDATISKCRQNIRHRREAMVKNKEYPHTYNIFMNKKVYKHIHIFIFLLV